MLLHHVTTFACKSLDATNLPCLYFFYHNREETKAIDLGASSRVVPNKRSSVSLPSTLFDVDFQALADAIESIAKSTAPLGKYIDGIHDNMLNERKHWIAEQEESRDAWESMQRHRDDDLNPLHEKLEMLEESVQSQVTSIKRLEESVKRNDKILKKAGVAHAY